MAHQNMLRLKSEELKERQEVADFLKAFADRLEANSIALRQGPKEVSLDIPENVDLGIEVEEKHKRGQIKHCLEIELNWLEERVKLAPAPQPVRQARRPRIQAVKNRKAPKVSKATRSAAKTMRKVKSDAARLSSAAKQLTRKLAKA